LHVAELDVIEKIKRAYYQLYFIEQAITITDQDQEQLKLIARIVDRRYTVERKVSQQDVLRLEVEISRLETELVRLRQQLESGQAALARLLHVSPETELRALDALPPEQIPQDIDLLYRQAITVRPELQAQLATIAKDRTAADRARLNYFPDVTLGLTWIDTANAGISPVTNGRDAFLLSAGVNLPIYKKRLNAAVRESEAAAVAGAREYDSLKDQTMQEVKDLFSQATSQQELLRLFSDDIIPKSEQALDQSIQSYQVGEVDFLQMIDNWRQLLRFQIGEKQLEAQLRQSVASLARVVGSYQLPEGFASAVEPVDVVETPTNSVIDQDTDDAGDEN
jgi:cobalt-zinc-cadmium efflux system outer membrane protein